MVDGIGHGEIQRYGDSWRIFEGFEGNFPGAFMTHAVCAGIIIGCQGGLDDAFRIGRCFWEVVLDYLMQVGS